MHLPLLSWLQKKPKNNNKPTSYHSLQMPRIALQNSEQKVHKNKLDEGTI